MAARSPPVQQNETRTMKPRPCAATLDTLWYQAVSLGVIALIASTALASAYRATGPAIAAAAQQATAASLAEVLPESFADNDLLRDTVEVVTHDGRTITAYRARKGGAVEGVVLPVSGKGYGGTIDLVMGIDRNGRVTGVRVTRHAETPGLGDKIEARRGPWIHGFTGKSLEAPARWAVKKDGGEFDQFAGATITPRAVVAAVHQGLELFASRRDMLLGESPPREGDER
jgi:electron transport complex protein RnfG